MIGDHCELLQPAQLRCFESKMVPEGYTLTRIGPCPVTPDQGSSHWINVALSQLGQAQVSTITVIRISVVLNVC